MSSVNLYDLIGIEMPSFLLWVICIYNEVCVGDLFEDGYITIQDLMILLAVYGTTCE